MNKIENLLVNYKPGEPDMKPDVLKQIQEIDAERKRRTEEIAKANSGQITITKDGKNIPLSNEQIVNILKQQQSQMQELTNIIRQKDMEIENLNKRLEVVTAQHESHSDNLKRVLSMLIERDQEIKDLRANIQKVDDNQISTTQENNSIRNIQY